jgi:hypothetical protein
MSNEIPPNELVSDSIMAMSDHGRDEMQIPGWVRSIPAVRVPARLIGDFQGLVGLYEHPDGSVSIGPL